MTVAVVTRSTGHADVAGEELLCTQELHPVVLRLGFEDGQRRSLEQAEISSKLVSAGFNVERPVELTLPCSAIVGNKSVPHFVQEEVITAKGAPILLVTTVLGSNAQAATGVVEFAHVCLTRSEDLDGGSLGAGLAGALWELLGPSLTALPASTILDRYLTPSDLAERVVHAVTECCAINRGN